LRREARNQNVATKYRGASGLPTTATRNAPEGDIGHQALFTPIALNIDSHSAGVDINVARNDCQDIIPERFELSLAQISAIMDENQLQAFLCV